MDCREGDFVLATAFADGFPSDAWTVGFVLRVDNRILYRRYMVSWLDAGLIETKWYRSAKRITSEQGEWLLDHRDIINKSRMSLWWWLEQL